MTRTRLLVAAAILLTVPAYSSGQDLLVNPSSDTCLGCLELRPIAMLGGADGPSALESTVNYLAIDSRRRFYVWSPERPFIWVFERTGKLIRRIGRDGDGPGEFRNISLVLVGAADSVYIFDHGSHRLTVLDSAYDLSRTEPLTFRPGLRGMVVPGGFLINATIRTSAQVGYPLHRLDARGRLISSFGSTEGVYRSDLREILEERAIAPSGANSIWSAWLNRYVIESWDYTQNQVARTIRRNARWFPEWWRPEAGGTTPPVPHTLAMQQNGDTLWVLIAVPASAWRSAVVIDPDGRRYRVEDRNAYLDTMIEAIELSTGSLLVSTRVAPALMGFAGPRIVYGEGYDRDDNPVIPVWEVHVTTRATRR